MNTINEIGCKIIEIRKEEMLMGTTATVRKSDYIEAMEENQKEIRKMVMDSYHDIEKGKGRDYKEFFAELESRYRNVNV